MERDLKALLAKAIAPPDPEAVHRAAYVERCHELMEARQMAGAGPWLVHEARATINQPGRFKEANPFLSQGATGDLDLALQNVEWRREVNFSLLEFSRWGIQQIILISRLYYLKHPWLRRGINLSAAYVFGQGVELSSPDPDANDVLKRLIENNKSVLGQIALTDLQKRKMYDGNLFWRLFPDTQDSGDVSVRLIDATEVQDIICNPDDAAEEWYFRRTWTQRIFDPKSGEIRTESAEAWYPALWFKPTKREATINGIPVQWDSPVYHRKVGGVASWIWGCPPIYPALEYSKEGKKFLEAFASVWQALHQIAIVMQTKGGQQAIMGAKGQMQTGAGPTGTVWDPNPTPLPGSTFASGPGTTVEAFNMKDAGGDPGRIKEFRNMVACVIGIPPTWLGDMETSNLSTAQTLDRPTELGFLLMQEEWQEDLVVMGRYALQVSKAAPSGKLKEALQERWKASNMILDMTKIEIREAGRKMKNCHWVYEASKQPTPDVIEVVCKFPAIREGDTPQQVAAIVDALTLRGQQVSGIDERAGVSKLMETLDIEGVTDIIDAMYPPKSYIGDYQDRTQAPEVANLPQLIDAVIHSMTLGNRQGQIVGIDEKEGIRMLFKLLQIPNADQIVEKMFPKGEYDLDRTKEEIAPPVQKLTPNPGGLPQLNPATGQPTVPVTAPVKEAELETALHNLLGALKIFEASRNANRPNGHA